VPCLAFGHGRGTDRPTLPRRRERAHSTPILDSFFENSQLNVDAGEVDVRPPGAPTTEVRSAPRLVQIGGPQPAELGVLLVGGVILQVPIFLRQENPPLPVKNDSLSDGQSPMRVTCRRFLRCFALETYLGRRMLMLSPTSMTVRSVPISTLPL
jgi:hypothetical protein